MIDLEVYGYESSATFQMDGNIKFNGNKLDIKTIDNTVFFNAKDVCRILDHDDSAISEHCKGVSLDGLYLPWRDLFRLARRSKSLDSYLFNKYVYATVLRPLINALDEVGYYNICEGDK